MRFAALPNRAGSREMRLPRDKPPPSPARGLLDRRVVTEHDIQKSIVIFLDFVLPPDQRVVGVSNNPRSRVMGGREKARGLKKGFPDLLICGRICGLMEVKRGGAHLTTHQREWREWASASRMRYALVRSIDDVRDALEAWGIKTREAGQS
jgi:hypothetical protein